MVNKETCGRCRHSEGDVRNDGSVVIMSTSRTCTKCRDRDLVRNKKRNNFSKDYRLSHQNCVYALTDKGSIVYIGSSKNTSYRLYEHFKCRKGGSHKFNRNENLLQIQVKYGWSILWFGDDGDDDTRVHQEKTLIQIHQPKFNKIKYKSYEG